MALAVTAPDRRRGRGGATSPTPVKSAAAELGIPVSERVADVLGMRLDLGLVVAFGRLVRPEVLADVPMVNVHFSLLPRWRGAAPVERAILAGDATTGVCLMALEEGLDTGPVHARAATGIGPAETAADLRTRLGELGVGLALDLLRRWPDVGEPEPQVGEATYAAKITVEELELDWSASAPACLRVVRVGRAWTRFRSRRLAVRRAELAEGASGRAREDAGGADVADCSGLAGLGSGAHGRRAPGTLVGDCVVTGDGLVRLVEVQEEGRPAREFSTWARGARPRDGELLGEGES